MRNVSLWCATTPEGGFPGLDEDLTVEVAIIGGGITGISLAHRLSQAGKRVVVLEAATVGGSTTGGSTGNLYATLDSGLAAVRDKWGGETAAAVARSRAEAVDRIEEIAAQLDIQCEFVRCPHYFIAAQEAEVDEIERELEAHTAAGLSASISDAPLPITQVRALRLENQAQFHPLRFTRSLAQAIGSDACRIFENSAVTEIDDDRKTLISNGHTVHFEKLVMATHTPKGFNVLQTELGPYREYGIACRLTDDAYPPPGVHWVLEPRHSLRTWEADGQRYLVVIGGHHKTGQQGETDYYGDLEVYARENFAVASVEYRWSAQSYWSADELPYIGKSTASEDVYLACGFGTNGLVYGPLAAEIITEDILGRTHPYGELYNARRFAPMKSAKNFLQENLDVVGKYARDYLTRSEAQDLESVPTGQGALVQVQGKKYAVYRGEAGELTVLSPVCTHLGCLVHWNGQEQSWDCPCHGSRFACDGAVLEAPALAALERAQLPDV